MPVYRFKSFEEAERAMWTFDPDAGYYERVRQLFDIAAHLSPLKCRRGVFKFRSTGEAVEFRRREEAGNAMAHEIF